MMRKTTFTRISLYLFLILNAFLLQSCAKDQFEKDQESINAYLKENGISDAVQTESGLYYRMLIPNTEENVVKAELGQSVDAKYTGSFLDGTVFDNNFGNTANFTVGSMIPGFNEGILLMEENSTYEFYLPSKLAYGGLGSSSIPPNTPLIFRVTLENIIHTDKWGNPLEE